MIDISLEEKDDATYMKATTNIEAITDIMQFSRCGALAQAFVMEAVSRYAKQVSEYTPQQVASISTELMSGETWQTVAKEIRGKLEAHFSK
jgi:hypothetical protein